MGTLRYDGFSHSVVYGCGKLFQENTYTDPEARNTVAAVITAAEIKSLWKAVELVQGVMRVTRKNL